PRQDGEAGHAMGARADAGTVPRSQAYRAHHWGAFCLAHPTHVLAPYRPARAAAGSGASPALSGRAPTSFNIGSGVTCEMVGIAGKVAGSMIDVFQLIQHKRTGV